MNEKCAHMQKFPLPFNHDERVYIDAIPSLPFQGIHKYYKAL